MGAFSRCGSPRAPDASEITTNVRFPKSSRSQEAYRDGHLDEDYFYARARRALTVLDNSFGREFFRDSRVAGTYLPEFMDWVDDTFRFSEEGAEFRNLRGVPQQVPAGLE